MTALLAVLAFGVSCHRMTPAAVRPFTITGSIVSIDAERVRLRHKSGQIVEIGMSPSTLVVRRGQPARVGDLDVGMRVVVLYRRVDDVWTADEIRRVLAVISFSPCSYVSGG